MPFVHVRITESGVTAEQKSQVIAGISDVLHQVLGKPPEITNVVIEEISTDNWGVGGKSVSEAQRQNE